MGFPSPHLCIPQPDREPEVEGIAVIDPLNMRIQVEGYGDMTEDVARELAAMRQADTDRVATHCAARQALIAREAEGATTFDGGEVVASIDEGIYQHWVDRYGAQFFREKGNREYFLRQHPECRVRARAASPSVRVDGYRVNDRRSSTALSSPLSALVSQFSTLSPPPAAPVSQL
jgi:hypothetical protein